MSVLDVNREITHESLEAVGFNMVNGGDPSIRYPHYQKILYSSSKFYQYKATLSTFKNILTVLCVPTFGPVISIIETTIGEIQSIDDLIVYTDEAFLNGKRDDVIKSRKKSGHYTVVY